MKSTGIKKAPGRGVLGVGGQAHEFFVRDGSHQMYEEIKVTVGEIFQEAEIIHMVNMNLILLDVEEEDKGDSLFLSVRRLLLHFVYHIEGRGSYKSSEKPLDPFSPGNYCEVQQ